MAIEKLIISRYIIVVGIVIVIFVFLLIEIPENYFCESI